MMFECVLCVITGYFTLSGNVILHKIHRWLYWATFPAGLALVMLGMMFYIDGYEIPLVVRVVYSSAIKICFGACICGLISGTIMRLDGLYRGIIEWRGWAPLSRVSYCAYLIHVCVIRTSCATNSALHHVSIYSVILNYCSVVGVTFILSVPLWLLVESPAAQFIKICLEGSSHKPAVTVKAAPPRWRDQELAASVETVVVKTSL